MFDRTRGIHYKAYAYAYEYDYVSRTDPSDYRRRAAPAFHRRAENAALRGVRSTGNDALVRSPNSWNSTEPAFSLKAPHGRGQS